MAIAESLVPFGFTALESEVYVFLLKLSPATGYRIAQGINKPAANTYKAIQSLQAKGAILVEEGPSRLCRAVPLEELMNRLQKNFEQRRKETEKQLKAVGKPTEDTRIYQLVSREQILNRIREMIATAGKSVLMKMPADAIRSIEGDIEKSAQRKIEIRVISNEALVIEGVDVVLLNGGAPEAIILVADFGESLMGWFGTEGDSQAIWTRNPTQAKIGYASLSAEYALAQVAAMLASDEKRSRMVRAIENRPKMP